jgi:hypothetical protein
MATETTSQGRPANQAETQRQIRTEQRREPFDGRVVQPGDHQLRDMTPAADETKGSLKTTEFWIYIAMVVAVLIASKVIGSSTAAHGDYFRADKAWGLVTLLTIGYLVSRGLAKAGSPRR